MWVTYDANETGTSARDKIKRRNYRTIYQDSGISASFLSLSTFSNPTAQITPLPQNRFKRKSSHIFPYPPGILNAYAAQT